MALATPVRADRFRAAADSVAVADSVFEASLDSLAEVEADSILGGRGPDRAEAAPDTGRSARQVRVASGSPLRGFDQPKWVMMRSVVIPGWGQFHNHAWWKGGLIAAGEVWLATGLISDKKDLERLSAGVDSARASGDNTLEEDLVNEYNTLLGSYQQRQWLLGGLLAYSMLDAYIDAHFRGFKLDFEPDPALPPGEGARISVGWDF